MAALAKIVLTQIALVVVQEVVASQAPQYRKIVRRFM